MATSMAGPEVELLADDAADDPEVVQRLTALINLAYAAGEAGLWAPGFVRIAPAEVAAAIRGGGMLVARADGRIVGRGNLRLLDAATAGLGLVSADPEHWGGGVGRALVRAGEEVARSRGADALQLELLVPRGWVHPEKDRLRAWYDRLGYGVVRSAPFEEVATHAASQLATPCEFLVFRKALASARV